MASQFDAFLEQNPDARDKPPDQVLEELYQTSGVQEPFEAFAEKALRDADRPMGRAAPREGRREITQDAPQEPKSESVVTDAEGNRINPNAKRGFGERIKQGAKEGFGERPIGRPEAANQGPWLYHLDEAVDTGMRGMGGAIGALGGIAGGAYEKFGGSKQGADKLQREVRPAVDAATAGASVLPPSGLPRVTGKMVRSQSERNFGSMMRGVDDQITKIEADVKAATELGDAERIGAAEAELARLRQHRERVDLGPPKPDDPIMSRIVPHPKGPQSAVINKFDHYYTAIKDDLHPLNKAVKLATGSFTGKHKMPAEYDPYVLARLTRGVVGQTEHFIKYGTFDFNTIEVNGPGLRDILAPVSGTTQNLDTAMRYAVSKRVMEKQGGQNIATGMDLEFAKRVVDSVETAASQPKPNEPGALAHWEMANNIVKAQKGLVGYNRALVKYLVDAGVVAKESAANFEAMNLDYLPFYRLMDDTQVSGKPARGGGGMNLIKTMRGSEREVLDPLESMIRNTNAFLTVAAQNRARFWLTRMAQEYDLPQIAEKVEYKARPIEVADTELKGFLLDHGIEPTGADSFTIFRPKNWQPAGNEISVMVGGKREVWRLDPAIAQAVNHLTRSAPNLPTRLLQIPAMMLRAGATRTPDFSLNNMWRDQFTAMSTSQYGYGPWDIMRSSLDLTAKDLEGYKEFLRAGGANVTQVAMDELRVEAARQNVMGRTTLEKAQMAYKVPLEVLQGISNISEYATRVGGYLNAKAEGATPAAAAYEARELTLDFARQGAQMQAWNLITAFMNAQMEGVDRMGRAFVTNPVRATVTSVGGITLPALYLWWANHDDPRYKNIPQWEKNMNFIFLPTDWKALPSTISKEELETYRSAYPVRQREDKQWEANVATPIKLAKPFEQGVVFGSAFERMMDVYWDKDPEGARGLKDAIGRAFLPNVVPTAAAPIVEHLSDYSFFLNRRLTPRRLADELPRYRYSEYTSETAKKIGAALDQIPGNKNNTLNSPLVIENYVRGWSGTLGVYALQGMDHALRQFGILEPSTRSASTGADIPGLRRFIVRYPSAANEPVSQFYEKYVEMQQTKNSLEKLKRQGKEGEAQALAAESAYTKVEPYSKALNAMRKFIEGTERLPLRDPNSSDPRGMTREEKRDLIDKTLIQMISVAKEANKLMEGVEKGTVKPPPEKKTATQQQAIATKDEGSVMFSNLNNAEQAIWLKRMSPEQRYALVPYARGDTKEKYMAEWRSFSPEQRKEILNRMAPEARKLWETAPTETPYDMKEILGGRRGPSVNRFNEMLDDAKREGQ